MINHNRRTFIRHLILASCTTLLPVSAFSAQGAELEEIRSHRIYVDGHNGRNSNDGTESSPLRTIQSASNKLPNGGDIVIREGVYRETVTVAYAHQSFSNYPNEEVTVTGLDVVTGWSLYKDGIYQANFSGFETQFTQVFANDAYMQMARYPNQSNGDMLSVRESGSGYADIVVNNAADKNDTTSNKRVVFNDMNNIPDDYWVGGYFRGISGKTWQNPHGRITSNSGNLIQVKSELTDWTKNNKNIPGSGWGFIFHLNALDVAGEWYAQDGKLYFKPEDNIDVNSLKIEAQKREWAFIINGKDNTSISGLNIKAASLQLKSDNTVVKKTSFRYIFPYFARANYNSSFKQQGGIYVNGNNNTFGECYVAHTWGNGFSIEDGHNNTIHNCIIEDIGWNAQFTSSVLTHAFNTTISNSTLGSTGRFHIRFNDKINILYNDIFDSTRLGQDAGSIEATSGSAYDTALDIKNSIIAYNHIHDSSTLPTSKAVASNGNSGKQFVVALYLEDVKNYTAHHNVIWNFQTDIKDDGTFVYLGPRRTTIENVKYYNNTVYNTHYRIRLWNRDRQGAINSTNFTNNLFAGPMVDLESTNTLLKCITHENELNDANPSDTFVDHLNGDFRLRASATDAINKGKTIAGITNNFVGSTPDIGAYEYGQPAWVPGASIARPCFAPMNCDEATPGAKAIPKK